MNQNPHGTVGDLGDDGYDRERRERNDDGTEIVVETSEPRYSGEWDSTVYASVVNAAAVVATCAHADSSLKRLANRFLTVEIKRWGELEDHDD